MFKDTIFKYSPERLPDNISGILFLSTIFQNTAAYKATFLVIAMCMAYDINEERYLTDEELDQYGEWMLEQDMDMIDKIYETIQRKIEEYYIVQDVLKEKADD